MTQCKSESQILPSLKDYNPGIYFLAISLFIIYSIALSLILYVLCIFLDAQQSFHLAWEV